jgi:hypothetical protein
MYVMFCSGIPLLPFGRDLWEKGFTFFENKVLIKIFRLTRDEVIGDVENYFSVNMKICILILLYSVIKWRRVWLVEPRACMRWKRCN